MGNTCVTSSDKGKRIKRYVFSPPYILITPTRGVVIDIIEFRTHSLDGEFSFKLNFCIYRLDSICRPKKKVTIWI